MNILDFTRKKQLGKKITMLTCYDYSSAQLIEQSNADCILVGDSAAMVMHGYPSTTHATMGMMTMHIAAVAKGSKSKFIIGDLPFLSYRTSLSETMHNVKSLMQAGAHAVKLEGGDGNYETISHIVQSGVPVMGHLGLTPQAIHQLGGHKVQGKSADTADKIKRQALALEKAGCFAVVLECVPTQLAAEITQQLNIATIGIGAGEKTNGQVLVWQDMLGLQMELKPKFLKHFATLQPTVIDAINNYVDEVNSVQYPSPEYAY